MFEEDDDFQLVETGLISLGNNRYDLFELFEKNDSEGNNFFYGKYDIKNRGFIAGLADNKEKLSTNLSCIARMRQKGLHRCRAAQVKLLKYRLYLN